MRTRGKTSLSHDGGLGTSQRPSSSAYLLLLHLGLGQLTTRRNYQERSVQQRAAPGHVRVFVQEQPRELVRRVQTYAPNRAWLGFLPCSQNLSGGETASADECSSGRAGQ